MRWQSKSQEGSLSISLFRTATKILLAFVSRAAWQHRYYSTKVGHWSMKNRHRRTGRGVRGELQPPPPPPNFGQQEKIWAKPGLKDVSLFFLLLFWRHKYFIFYSDKNPDVGRRNNQVTFSRDIGCLARDEFLVIRKGYHTLIYIFIVF